MFVGRERELAVLERLYSKRGFQMAVVYGRRRVGKTSLIDEFAKGKPHVLSFTALQKSSLLNIQSFSRALYRLFELPTTTPPFALWEDAFAYIGEKLHDSSERFVFVFDEFPYAAETAPELPSVLQNAIDHRFKQTNMLLILCGSNEGFMESGVLGVKSPLYGRRTAQLRIKPFDFIDAARMLPHIPNEDRVKYYATFGGTPYYLEQIDTGASYEYNVESQLFNITGLLYEEPLMLLRQELREPALYNSILDAIGAGANRPNEIADKSGVAVASLSKYLRILEDLGLIEKAIPFGANSAKSRKGIYRFADPFFSYWYRFVSPNMGSIEHEAGKVAAQTHAFGDGLSDFIGHQFEIMCLQWLVRKNAAGELPFPATSFGQWWGSDPVTHQTADVDVIAANTTDKTALFGECKWRNDFDETEALRKLEERADLVGQFDRRYYALFSKKPAGAGTKRKCNERSDIILVSADEMFEEM